MAARRAVVVGAAWVAMVGAALAQDVKPEMDQSRAWSDTLVQDATSLHDIMVDSHPGTHDPLNPEFRERLDEGLVQALERSGTARDSGGWWWALRKYVASFQDGHVAINAAQRDFALPTHWPGFLTAYRGGRHIVLSRLDGDSSTPPLGARLIACDGVGAESLAEQRVGRFRGRWFLEAQRAQFSDWLFLNASNPWIEDLALCQFDVEGEVLEYALNWRPIDAASLAERRTQLAQTIRPEAGLRHFDDGGFWISTPSFNGDPAGQTHADLTALIADMNDKQAALRQAPYVVLDLRGNGGGSSHWSELMAMALWSMDWLMATIPASNTGIDWRASDANLAEMQAMLDQQRAQGGEANVIVWIERVVAGMTAAKAANQAYWRDGGTGESSETATGDVPAVTAPSVRVYVLTDLSCASACLDAVDLWKAAGGVQIGRETNADSVYMDIRTVPLASGLATLALPMKVYRGRARGNNEPQRPTHVFDGDMTDTAALLAFVRQIEEERTN